MDERWNKMPAIRELLLQHMNILIQQGYTEQEAAVKVAAAVKRAIKKYEELPVVKGE
jgi:hypothetical protein